MAKKRKAPKSFEQPNSAKSAKHDVEETFDDSEDEFYAGRDKILLDESADTKRKRRLVEQEKDLQLSDEEILAYRDEEENEDDISEDQGESDYDDEQRGVGERVMADRARRSEHEEEEDEESEEEHWGTNREEYYGDDVIETEEQAREEENEAKRLHQKQLKNMTEADFGFDENEWVEAKKDTSRGRSVTEKLPDAQIPEGATNEQKLNILKSRYLQPCSTYSRSSTRPRAEYQRVWSKVRSWATVCQLLSKEMRSPHIWPQYRCISLSCLLLLAKIQTAGRLPPCHPLNSMSMR